LITPWMLRMPGQSGKTEAPVPVGTGALARYPDPLRQDGFCGQTPDASESYPELQRVKVFGPSPSGTLCRTYRFPVTERIRRCAVPFSGR
jgi:hypothetical protein